MRSKQEREDRDGCGRSLAEVQEHCRVAIRKVRVSEETLQFSGAGRNHNCHQLLRVGVRIQ